VAKEMCKMTIGEKIKQLRIKNKLSQEALATALNTTKQAIYKYESGIVTNIPMDKITILASILGTTPAFLMGWDEKEFAPTERELSEGEKKLLQLFRLLPREAQESYTRKLEESLENLGLI
jgi:transcriptional regulator with XRE-family HTH domain